MPDPAARLFRNALCRDGQIRNLAVRAGRFVEADALGDDADIVDLKGLLALPAFVEGHIHLDKSFVGDRWQPHRPADTLADRLAVEKRLLDQARPVEERADALLAQAHSLGTVAMRSHVDIDAVLGLSHLHAVQAARERWRGRVDVEIVAFPQADLARGVGGRAVPVTLSRRGPNDVWQTVGTATTDADGRVRRFGDAAAFDTGIYRLQFDMSAYPDATASPFFPEITLTFRVTDKMGHYHVPVVVSP